MYHKVKQLDNGRGLQKMRLMHNKINLMSPMMVIKKSQNVHKICFQPILMTFICDINFDIIMCKPLCVNLFL